jgi:glycosyltransferase involved in cell wall biosynthesis
LVTAEDSICFRKNRPPRLLVFGYPSQAARVGGLLWSKRVSDAINALGVLEVRNISSERSMPAKLDKRKILRNIIPCLIKDFCDAVHGLLTLPNIALLDSWGEANIILWRLLRIFKPSTRIVIVFHHHEPRILSDHISEINSAVGKAAAKLYNSFVARLTEDMMKDSDMILTVSSTSAMQLSSLYGIKHNGIKINNNTSIEVEDKTLIRCEKIRIVGIGIDKITVLSGLQKDIDFFCIGRSEKLDGIEKIWSAVRKFRPEANFVMIGRASQMEINHLASAGIDHKGQVSDEEKIELYSRAKVFLFPSSREGFGIALAEALQVGMAAVIWRLPVFEELYLDSLLTKQGMIRLVEFGNYELFAKEAVKALDMYDTKHMMASHSLESSSSSSSSSLSTISASEGKKKTAAATATISVLKLKEGEGEQQYNRSQSQTWEQVADKVVKAIFELI